MRAAGSKVNFWWQWGSGGGGERDADPEPSSGVLGHTRCMGFLAVVCIIGVCDDHKMLHENSCY
jgi:hypothetical protein